ncbi:hypothetical protein FQN54_004304 [Arachnomyces sp. PD_36]|nr:hypothetical protein FQN54_004304 [Arachnomyces sp. PD_36]
MFDGREFIARVPNPNAGPPHFTIASEAATLEFLRTVLDLPVPKVYSWSTDSTPSNPVGAEYMIMEKIQGKQLTDVWADMSPHQQFGLVKNLVPIEAKLAESRLASYGSIYFRDFYPKSTAPTSKVLIDSSGEECSKFVIGETAERSFWEKGRGSLQIDRGPWKSIEDYFAGVAKREIAWLDTMRRGDAGSRSEVSEKQQELAAIHMGLLEQFLAVLPYIIPKDKAIGYPTLWHTDLHHDNIFVDESDPSKITGIIDWQGVEAAPFFMQARFPSIFECDHPYPWGTVAPQLPENYETLPDDEKERAKVEYQEVRLKKFYEIASRKFNPLVFRAMDITQNDDDNQVVSTIFDIIGRSWIDGPVPLRELLIQVVEAWHLFSDGNRNPCPISYPEEQISQHRKQAEVWGTVYQSFSKLRRELVGDKDGWVSHEEYEEAKARYENEKGRLAELRREVEQAGGGWG